MYFRKSLCRLQLVYKRSTNDEGGGSYSAETASNTTDMPRKMEWLCCANCGIRITHPVSKVIMQGSHSHQFTNPAGLSFKVACFAVAENTTLEGESTLEHSWFIGYAWQVVCCQQCKTHLGWRFKGNRDAFFGFIADQLKPEST